MLNPIRSFRYKHRSAAWQVVLAFWAVSTINLFISPAFTFPEKDHAGVTALHVVHAPDSSLLEALMYLVYSAVNPNADLADTVEDTIDKVEFIATGASTFEDNGPAQDHLFVPPHGQLTHTDLEKSTPPPENA